MSSPAPLWITAHLIHAVYWRSRATFFRPPLPSITRFAIASFRITIVHQAALGDTVLLIPLFRALKDRFAGMSPSLTLVSRANLGQMLTMLGFIDAYASADDRDHTLWFAPPNGLMPNSSPAWAQCDLMLSAVSRGGDAWAKNAALAMHPSAGGLWNIETPLLFFEPRPPADYAGHVTAWHREQLSVLGLKEPAPPLPRVNPDGAIVVHPGSGGEAKCWPRESFLKLGRDLKRNGILPTLVLGEAEQERWGNAVIDSLKDEFPWYLHMGLYELAERLGRARLYLGNDSGVTQLAAAMGVPVIALFGPSDDTQWRPVGSNVKVLRAPDPDAKVLAALKVETVLAEILAELRKIE